MLIESIICITKNIESLSRRSGNKVNGRY